MHRGSLTKAFTFPIAGLALLACLTIARPQDRKRPTPTPVAEKRASAADQKKGEAKKEEEKPFKIEEAIARKEKNRIVFKPGFEVTKSSNSTATVRRVTKNTAGNGVSVSCICSDGTAGCKTIIVQGDRLGSIHCEGPACCAISTN
ncbi:MAG TPA: hypothetical protein VFD58_19570 [Blastocatellia bacterium]|nr:hypothetical protein [Blastocatellia bacterium]